jgi:hypothetical protein
LSLEFINPLLLFFLLLESFLLYLLLDESLPHLLELGVSLYRYSFLEVVELKHELPHDLLFLVGGNVPTHLLDAQL